MAGHSLGEYTALVCADSLSFADGLKLVQNRGKYMQMAVERQGGAMAAILGLDKDKVREICRLRLRRFLCLSRQHQHPNPDSDFRL